MRRKIMRRKILLILIVVLCAYNYSNFPSAAESIKYDIDFSDSSNGIVKVLYNTDKDVNAKLIIFKDGAKSKYIYNLYNSTEYESFSLQLGSGQYKVGIYENISDTRYKEVFTTTENVIIDNENNIYLNSIQEIKWNNTDEAIILANNLVNQALIKKQNENNDYTIKLTEEEIINVIYTYVVKNISYDYDKINYITSEYIPDINKTILEKKGICYDYSSLFAAMLRSQGIPTKLVKGYTKNINAYHAWNEVYLSEQNKWIVVDTTYDASMYRSGQAYNLIKANEDYTKELFY